MRRVLFVTGIPGSGKSSLSKRLANALDRRLLTMHELVMLVDPGAILNGDMAKESTLRRAFLSEMDELEHQEVVVDGWPRTEAQAMLIPDDSMVFLLTCRPEIARDRLLRRGRGDDTGDLIEKRIREQAVLLAVDEREGWAYTLAGYECTVNTSLKSADAVAAGVLAYLQGRKRQAFDTPSHKELEALNG